MGKLNIAHHKSYHPYRRDNIERVQKDEEEARLKEEKEEGRMRLADSEARIDLLRQRAGLKTGSKKSKADADADDSEIPPPALPSTSAAPTPDTIQSSTGHINLFAPLEASQAQATSAALAVVRQKGKDKGKEDEEGVRLAPSKSDLKPWYTDEDLKSGKEREQGESEREVRRIKDLSIKSSSDPLREVNTLLAQRSRAKATMGPPAPPRRPQPPKPTSTPSASDPALSLRLARESAERQRALALIERKRRESMAAETDTASTWSTPARDVYNLDAVRAAEERRRNGWGNNQRERDRDGRREGDRRWGREREIDVGRIRDKRW